MRELAFGDICVCTPAYTVPRKGRGPLDTHPPDSDGFKTIWTQRGIAARHFIYNQLTFKYDSKRLFVNGTACCPVFCCCHVVAFAKGLIRGGLQPRAQNRKIYEDLLSPFPSITNQVPKSQSAFKLWGMSSLVTPLTWHLTGPLRAYDREV